MLPSDMNLNIRSGSVGYTNKILLSDGTFSLGKNSKVNTLELAKISHKVVQQPLLIKTRNQLILGLSLTMRKNCLHNLWQVFLQYGLCFSERLNLNIQTLSYDLIVINPIHPPQGFSFITPKRQEILKRNFLILTLHFCW